MGDQIYPGWKEKLGYTGESSVQAASFDWQKKAAAAAMTSFEAPPSYYAKTPNAVLTYWADVGYFADGTSIVKSGNAIFRPPQPDPHMAGAALPISTYQADVGYFVDGTPLPASKYEADIGYFVDGTAIDKAGNALFR